MATLNITVNYDGTNFSYGLSYTDRSTGKVWTATVDDGGTIAFVQDAYPLSDGQGTVFWLFDAVDVQLGSSLSGCGSCCCGLTGTFDLSSIVFPEIISPKRSEEMPYSWCQATSSSTDNPKYKDPKLGLSNTTGTKGITVTDFPSCSCPPQRRG